MRQKRYLLAGSTGTHSVCVCSMHQNAVLLVDAIDWDVNYKDLINKVVCDSSNKECMMHCCESCSGIAGLKEFLDEQLCDINLDIEYHYSHWNTTDHATLATMTTTYKDYKEILIETIDKLTRYSYLAKCQAQYLKSKKESLGKNEALVLGDFAENYQFLIQDEIQSYQWSKEYCTFHPLVIYHHNAEGHLQHLSLCFISDNNTHDRSFVYQIQTIMVDYLKETLPRISKTVYFSDGCGEQYKNYKNFINMCCHKNDFEIDAEWGFSATSHGKSPCDGTAGAVKCHTAKRSLQRPLNNQIRDYQSMLPGGNAIDEIFCHHHFTPLSPSQIGDMLSSEDDSFVDTFDFSLPTTLEITDIRPSTYITCLYNSFWWVGMVTDVHAKQGDVKVDFMHPHGPRKTFNWSQSEETCYVPMKNIPCVISAPTTSQFGPPPLKRGGVNFNYLPQRRRI